MILYFADRHLNILGQASTHLPKGIVVTDDVKTEDVDSGVTVFECDLNFTKETRGKVEEWAELGNYIICDDGDEQKLFTIIDAEIDTKKQTAYIYAEDEGMDLLNEIVGAYEADQPYPIETYIERFAGGAGWSIGVNEAEGLTKKLTFDNEETASARLLQIAEAFNDCELSYSFKIKGLKVVKKYINIYEERGKDTGVQLRLNKEIDSIITTKSIANMATALRATGGTPDNADKPITLLGYEYDDGNFYVDGHILKSRKALEKWSRYLWKGDDTQQQGGHIVKTYSDSSLSQAVLCSNAIKELKSICDMEVNYEADIKELPEHVKVGDRVNIIDDEGGLYLSSRILSLETSAANNTRKAIIGEHLIRKSGISTKVEKLAAEFAERAQEIARAQADATAAQNAANEATNKANAAETAATNARQAAENAQADADAAAGKVATAEAELAEVKSTYATKQEVEDIEIGGRNLIVLSALKEGYRMSSDGSDYASAYSSLTGEITVTSGKEMIYTVHCVYSDEGDCYFQTAFFAGDGTFISRPIMYQANTTSEKTSWKTTVPENAAYAKVAFPTSIKDNIKLEYGDKATDWTPAPEDINEGIATAQNDANTAKEEITAAQTIIQQLSNAISMLVVDEDGTTLMQQTSEGWSFNLTSAEKAATALQETVSELQESTGNTQATVETLQQAISDVEAKTDYVNIEVYKYTDENGVEQTEPCIELGETDNDSKLLVTNKRILFQVGTSEPTQITQSGVVTKNIEVEEELMQGIFVWKRHGAGNLGLTRKGASS